MSSDDTEHELHIQRYVVKRLIKWLESARGLGTSVISLYVTPREQISRVTTMLNNELGTASNIKSHTNKLSVQAAITSALGRLKQIPRVPPNGFILYAGTVLTEDGKEKKITRDYEPFKPVSRSLYMCDNKFHTEELHRLLESDDKYGFIVVDGTGSLFAAVTGSVKEVLAKLSVELPKKHGRGGQSKNRFARIRQERRHNYVRKVCEVATQVFITNDRPNIQGIVLAGSAEFKETIALSDLFDPRLKAILIQVVDVAHPGEVGLNQAIDLASDSLGSVKLIQEKKLVQKFFDEIAKDSSMYCFGVKSSMSCLDMGAVDTLIVYEDLDVNRYEIKTADGTVSVHFLTPEEFAKRPELLMSADQSANEIDSIPIVDFLAQDYRKFGCTLEIITNKSQEGTQFVRGFGGIGGLLRYRVDLVQMARAEEAGDHAVDATKEDRPEVEVTQKLTTIIIEDDFM